ncbi:MAG: hypothetical protein K6F91_10645, partial [Ruminococcus sp.]|nr:hypothetical protein [Ruminococcus sp.]
SSVLDKLSATLAELYNKLPVSEIRLCRTLEPCYESGGQLYYNYPGDKYNSRLVWQLLIDIPIEDRPQMYKKSGRMVSYIFVDALTGDTVFDIEPYTEERIKIDGGLKEESSKIDSVKEITIQAVAKCYENEQLTFEYEGISYKLPLPSECFARKEMGISRFYPDIINNCHGETVKADIIITEDMSRIISCDIYTPNGKVFDMPVEFNNDGSINIEYDFTLHRGEGSKCCFTNKDMSIDADLNDLPMYLKLDYPDGTTPVLFDGFMFNDGTFMLFDLNTNRKPDGGYEWSEDSNTYGLCFIGEVISVKNERAELLLRDKKTRIDIPIYFNDGEVRKGETVMAMIYDDGTLYNSGRIAKYDYALIFTQPEKYLPVGMKIEDAAYAQVVSLYREYFKFTGKAVSE